MPVYPSGRRFYSKIRLAPGQGGRRTYQLAAGLDQAGAEVRDALLDELARAMRGAGLDVERVIDPMLAKVAAAEAAAEVERLERYVRTRLLAGKRRSIEEAPTVRQFGAWWVAGELARRYPEQVERRKSAHKDQRDLERHVYPAIGDVLISAVQIEHVEQVLRALPAGMAKGTKAKILNKLHRLLDIARYPGRYLDHNPMPRGFGPRPGRTHFPFLYPGEEAQLLGCRAVPLARRLAYGLSARAGLRLGEVVALRWADLDLEHGALRLLDHKTVARAGARLVPLDPASVRVLTWWQGQQRASYGEGEGEGEGRVVPLSRALADMVRADLRAAGVLRAELHQSSLGAKSFAFHGLRRTFVTLSLGAGQSEDWVMRRTGHTSSAQLHRYRIAAATAAEFRLGWLQDFDRALAETADSLPPSICPLSVKNDENPGVAGSRLPTHGGETSENTPEVSREIFAFEGAGEGANPHRGQGADRLSWLIEEAIAEARALLRPQVEIRLRNALAASSKRRAS